MWSGNAWSDEVMGHSSAIDVDMLKKSSLTTSAGRDYAGSCPTGSEYLLTTISPFRYSTYHISFPTGPPQPSQ